MRNAAKYLGIIAGLIGIVVGFFAYGFAVVAEMWEAFADIAREVGRDEVVEDPLLYKAVGLGAPILAIVGGAMAPRRPLIAMLFLAASCAGMHYGLGFNIFTMFPIAMTGLAGVLALLGGLLPSAEAKH
jgi:hypothetical protein